MSHNIDLELKNLLLRELPVDESFRTHAIILANQCDNDIVRMILERAKLRIIDSIDAFFRKVEIRVPFDIEPFDVARLLRQYEGVSDIQSIRSARVSDLDFQVHKTAMVQQCVLNLCRADFGADDDMSAAEAVYFDGFEPADFGLFYATKPKLAPVVINNGRLDTADNSFTIINLFDSKVTITELYISFNRDRLAGAELFLIVPYDIKMWTVDAANIIEGAYSYQWVLSDTSFSTELAIRSALLPVDFFENRTSNFELRIRPYGSNKILKISKDEFIAVFAHGNETRSFPETRRIAHGFAEVSIINFYPILNIHSTSGLRNQKRSIIPYNKRIIKRKLYTNFGLVPSLNFSTSLEPPWEYIIDEKLYDRTRKAAIQTRITRNLIVPLLYHLFSHSTHIVFNGAIVTLQKVISPELNCQLTEHVLHEIIPIKIKILQAGNAIKANSVAGTDVLSYSLKSLLIHAYEKSKDPEVIIKTVRLWISNPQSLQDASQNNPDSRTFDSYASQSLQVIQE